MMPSEEKLRSEVKNEQTMDQSHNEQALKAAQSFKQSVLEKQERMAWANQLATEELKALEQKETELQEHLTEAARQLHEKKKLNGKLESIQTTHTRNYDLKSKEYDDLLKNSLLGEELDDCSDLNQINLVLNREKTKHIERLGSKTKQFQEVMRLFDSIVSLLINWQTKKNEIPFKGILRQVNNDQRFFDELLGIQLPDNSTLKDYYTRQNSLVAANPSDKEYERAMEALKTDLQTKSTAAKEIFSKEIQAIKDKIGSLEKMHSHAVSMDSIKKFRSNNATQLQRYQQEMATLQAEIESGSLFQAQLIQKKESLKLNIAIQSNIITHFKAMEDLLEKDLQNFEANLSLQTWNLWEVLGKKHQSLLAEYRQFGPDCTGMESLFQQSDEQGVCYLLFSLESYFTKFQENKNRLESLSLTPFKTSAQFDGFILEYNQLLSNLQEVEEHFNGFLNVLTPVLAESIQQKMDTFSAQIREARASCQMIASQASKNSRDLIANLRREIKKSNAKSKAFKTAENNLDLIYNAPYSLYEFLSLSHPSLTMDKLLESIEDYKKALVLKKAYSARESFVDALIFKYSMRNKELKTKLSDFVTSGDFRPLLDCLDTKLKRCQVLATQNILSAIFVEVYEYTRLNSNFKHRSFPSQGMVTNRLNSFRNKDNKYFETMNLLYAKVSNIHGYAKTLEDEFRTRDSKVFTAFADKVKEDLDFFVLDHKDNSPNEKDYQQLQQLILSRIRSENSAFGNHIKKWKPILINIAIGIFIIPTLVKLAYSHSFFYAKTQREEQVDDLKNTALAMI